MRLAFGSSFGLEHGSWLETLREILEGMLAGSARAFYIMMAWWYSHVLRPIAQLVGIPIPVYEHPKIVNGTIKVAGVGYSRTGTVSRTRVIQQLLGSHQRTGLTVQYSKICTVLVGVGIGRVGLSGLSHHPQVCHRKRRHFSHVGRNHCQSSARGKVAADTGQTRFAIDCRFQFYRVGRLAILLVL